MRILLSDLITKDLGYCCEWAFFYHYRKNRFTPLIAARLGVSTRAVQKHKAAYRTGGLACNDCGNCLKRRLQRPQSPESQ